MMSGGSALCNHLLSKQSIGPKPTRSKADHTSDPWSTAVPAGAELRGTARPRDDPLTTWSSPCCVYTSIAAVWLWSEHRRPCLLFKAFQGSRVTLGLTLLPEVGAVKDNASANPETSVLADMVASGLATGLGVMVSEQRLRERQGVALIAIGVRGACATD